jgi:arylsulfatase
VDQLGAVEIETAPPVEGLRVIAVIDGRPLRREGVVAVPDSLAPERRVARFRRGRWNRSPVEALRIELPPGADAVLLRRLRVTTERYAALPAPPSRPRSMPERVPGMSAEDTGADGASLARRHGRAPSVVLLVADTLRADHMSLYGHARSTTPALERLSRSAVVFERAWSQSACTFPSVNSLLTSQPAASFLGEPARARRDLTGRGGLAERLRAAGYRTWAVSASWVVRATDSPHNDWGGGYGAGFDVFDESCADEAAACVNGRAIDLIDEHVGDPTPFFLYLHYLDPHDPYRPPPDHPRRFADSFEGPTDVALGDPNRIVAEPGRASAPELRQLVDLYDEEIRYLDDQIDRLFAALRERALLEHTIVVLAADHGEAFGEHGDFKHCGSVYEEQTRTPLVFWLPDRAQGRRVDRPTENLDLVPTLLDLVGVAAVAPPMHGTSLKPDLEGRGDDADLAFSSQGAWQSVTDGRFKWIENVDRKTGELFDLAHDPAERTALRDAGAEIRARLEAALQARFRNATERARNWDRVARELRALGYLD